MTEQEHDALREIIKRWGASDVPMLQSIARRLFWDLCHSDGQGEDPAAGTKLALSQHQVGTCNHEK